MPAKKETLSYVDFDVLSEPWNLYNLADGSRLRLRFILHKVGRLKYSDGKEALRVSNGLLTIVEVPVKLRGMPGPAKSTADLEGVASRKLLNWSVAAQGQNVYRLGGEDFLTVEIAPVEVFRTEVYGPDADPYYLVKTTARSQLIRKPARMALAPGAQQSVPAISRSGSTKTRVRLNTR